MIDINNLPQDGEEVIIHLKSGGTTKATWTARDIDNSENLSPEVVGRFKYKVNDLNIKATIRNNGFDTSGIEKWEKVR